MAPKQRTSGPQPDPEELRRYVRRHGADFLADPNVTSVGVGYKITDGTMTDTVAISFTVAQKLAEPDISLIGSELLPTQVQVGREAVPTDVIERDYRPAYVIVPDAAADDRRRRIDPVVPGVSIAHPTLSTGTAGAVVYDTDSGTPYLLSNWHVLQGEQGAVGDDVVQPGPHDDNRAGRNRVGTLVRSHLGVAGDCAVTTVEDRGVDPTILELDVIPDRLGEPELDDTVIKSGRTTGVTYGIVTRVDVMVGIDYGGAVGERSIGCFEISADPAHPPEGGRLSDGGDSGSAWLFRAGNGRTSSVLAGVHFAGQTPGTGEDHGLACLSTSVFDKLGITLDQERAAQARAEEAARGYDATFLGQDVPVPELGHDIAEDAAVVDGSPLVPYTHFSLTMSVSRRFARWVAWNVDGGGLKKLPRTGNSFRLDDRVRQEHQVGNELYADNPLDRGHLARRSDLLWGPDEEAQQANVDSFYYTNIAPQMDGFNQGRRGGVWGRLEDALYEDVEVQGLRIAVFAGPVLGDDDQVYRDVAVPREYWKVVAYVTAGELRGRAFLLTQNLDRLETLDLGEFRTYQVTLGALTERTSLDFPEALTRTEAGPVEESVREPRALESTADILW